MAAMFSIPRILAVAERDLRRFKRNLKLMIPIFGMPVIYLLILGNAMGGDLRHIRVGVVSQDAGPAATAVLGQLQTMSQSREILELHAETNLREAMDRLRSGTYRAVVVIPPGFSARVSRGEQAGLGLAVDNTDGTVALTLDGEFRAAMRDLKVDGQPTREKAGVRLDRVDIYGHKRFIQYLVPGVIALALFFVGMLSGGIILVDDRARGIHEGYYVTPLTSVDLVAGLTLSATSIGLLVGSLVFASSVLIAQLPLLGGLRTVLLTELTILLLSSGLVLFMFTLMARVSNPVTPRALFGILNVLTFFPSGALYPPESYPGWLQAMSFVNPMRYAVHALRLLLLKGVDFQAVAPDLLVLLGFSLAMLVLASLLFKRTL